MSDLDRFDALFQAVGSVDSNVKLLLEMRKDHAARIERLERDRTRMAGAFLGLSTAMTWLTHDKIPGLLALLH